LRVEERVSSVFERKVTDARGRVFVVPPPEVVPPTDERARRLHALRAEFYGAPSGIGGRLLVGGVIGGMLGVLLYRECKKYFGPADQLGSIVVSVIAGMGAAFGGFRLNVRVPNYHVVGAGIVEMKVCLVCGYDLRAVPRAGDRCTVCPECGAAWSLG
jgi:hypothetical protein